MSHNHQKKIAAINDFCGFGRCSLTVSLPVISAMGVQCCPVPTAIFSNHTGYDSFYRTDFTCHMENYLQQWERLDLRFQGILTGFLGSQAQIDIVLRFLERFRGENTVTVVDPVMGDDGILYPGYDPALARRMRELASYADILTPNLTEACILTDTPYHPDMDEEELLRICRTLNSMGPKTIVISGLERGEDLDNFICEAGKPPVVVTAHKVGVCRAGTGDVFSAILAAHAVNGVETVTAVRHAAGFIGKVLRRCLELELPQTDGLCFEEFLPELRTAL